MQYTFFFIASPNIVFPILKISISTKTVQAASQVAFCSSALLRVVVTLNMFTNVIISSCVRAVLESETFGKIPERGKRVKSCIASFNQVSKSLTEEGFEDLK